MNCPYCNNPAEWVSNAEVYGRPYGKSWMMYLCRPCDARVGCHQNSQTPLGTMANKELRGWRIKAHDAIDPMKERHPRGVSDDPRPRMEKACERLSEPPEPERARAFWCLPPAPFFGFLYRSNG